MLFGLSKSKLRVRFIQRFMHKEEFMTQAPFLVALEKFCACWIGILKK
jgi:hypothetical protein